MKLAEKFYDTAMKVNPKMTLLMETYNTFMRLAERASERGVFAIGIKKKFYPSLSNEDFLQISEWAMDEGFRCYFSGTGEEETFMISWKYTKNKI